MLRVIVAGSRYFTDYAFVAGWLQRLLGRHHPDVLILSGGQRGVDALGERYAREHSYLCERYPADWETHGRTAGPRRNEQMALRAQACVVFDGGGPGSRSMIAIAKTHNLLLRVVPLP